MSEQLSAEVKALLERMRSHPRDERLSVNMGIEIVELGRAPGAVVRIHSMKLSSSLGGAAAAL